MAGDWYDAGFVERSGTVVGPPLPAPPVGDQVVVLSGVSWSHYDALSRARNESPRPRLAYLDGELEIMTTGRPHETKKKLLARLLEIYALEKKVPLNGFGSETLRKKAKKAGLEPDECYSIGRAPKLPELALEVVETSGGIDKLEAYRRLGVREVWFFVEGRIFVFVLVRGQYRAWNRSAALPALDLAELAKIVQSTPADRQAQAVASYWRSLRRRKRKRK